MDEMVNKILELLKDCTFEEKKKIIENIINKNNIGADIGVVP